MNKKEAQKRAEKLRETINHHRYLYHVEDRQEISDNALDSLKNKLFLLENEFPELVVPDSPTQRVGGKPLDKFKKVRHEARMLSFNDAFNEEDIKNWTKRLENYLGSSIKKEFYCELKIDGFAIELVYEDGVLVQGSSRGDGNIGEDITQNLKTIEAIPLKLAKNKDIPKRLIVRGEVFLNKKEFDRINKKLKKSGESIYANPRNLAAGTIRQLNPRVASERKLDSFAYDIVLGQEFEKHSSEHEALRKWGFKTNPHNKIVNSLEESFKLRNRWDKNKEKLPYEVDGLVIIVNNNKIFNDLSAVGKAPRGAIAYKFSPKEATTTVLDISLQVGRTGILTPVAHLEPISLGGVTVRNSTLHNYDEIKRLGVRLGDTVVVVRSGDVIPKITKVLKEMRSGGEVEFKMPKKCPIDNSNIVKDGVYYRCSNKKCGAIQRKSLEHFVSRGAFSIEGLGGKILERFIDEGLIKDSADIFKLKTDDIKNLSQFGEKSAENIVNEIGSNKKISLPRFIYSLSIRNVGLETAEDLSKKIVNTPGKKKNLTPRDILDIFINFGKEDIENIPDIGPKISQEIYNWFRQESNTKLLKKFDDVGINIIIPERLKKTGKLDGVSFVLTGTLSSLSRDKAKELIKEKGGSVVGSVSQNTDYVVVGAETGTKLKKAMELKIKTLNEKEFLKILG